MLVCLHRLLSLGCNPRPSSWILNILSPQALDSAFPYPARSHKCVRNFKLWHSKRRHNKKSGFEERATCRKSTSLSTYLWQGRKASHVCRIAVASSAGHQTCSSTNYTASPCRFASKIHNICQFVSLFVLVESLDFPSRSCYLSAFLGTVRSGAGSVDERINSSHVPSKAMCLIIQHKEFSTQLQANTTQCLFAPLAQW